MAKNTKPAEPPLERAARSVAELHAQHLRELPRSQLGIEWLTDRIGRPWFAYAVVGFTAAWVVAETFFGRSAPFNAVMFQLLQFFVGTCALVIAIFILITENHQGAIAEKRAQLMLQLSLANEERAAKIIELLEEMRRDDPSLPNRRDDEAKQMAAAVDLKTAMEKMEDAGTVALKIAK